MLKDWTNTDRDTYDETTQVNLKDLMTKEINKKYSKKELEAFLTKAYDLVNEALLSRRDEIFIIKNDDDDTDDLTQNTLFKFSCLDGINSQENKTNKISSNTNTTPLKISDMTWSCKGSVLAISYYSENHVGPCSHTGYVAFFKFDSFNPDSKESCVYTKTYSSKTIVEINSCVKCIENHPTINNIFVAGTYKGELYYINIGNEKDLIECSSKVDSCLYREQLVSIKFVKMDDNLYYIVSISNEGRVLVWNPEHKLKYLVLGFNLKYPVKVPNNPINPSCFANNPYEAYDFIIGAFDGSLYKCQFNKPNDDSGKDHDFVFMEKKELYGEVQ